MVYELNGAEIDWDFMTLRLRNGVYYTRTKFRGKLYHRTLRTRKRSEAKQREAEFRLSLSGEVFGSLPNEVWKHVPGYRGLYQVSNLGRLRKFRTGRVLKGRFSRGRLYVALYKGGVPKQGLLGRLVARAFIPNSQNKPDVNYINPDRKWDNSVSDLGWATKAESMERAVKNGRMKGKTGQLSIDLANEIRILRRRGYKYRELSERFGVSEAVLYALLRNRSYRGEK